MNNAKETPERITWDKTAEAHFLKILEQIPALIRGIAETRVTRKAESILREANRTVITEKDMVDAFFAETPPAFFGQMKEGMQELGIDYTQYGHT